MGTAVVACRAPRGGGRCAGHDEVDLEPDQFPGQLRKPLDPALGGSILDDDVLSLDVAALAQPPSERVECRARLGRLE